MILSAHQPAYLPWLGYFDKMIRSDVFVYLDAVQFEKNSFTNRNKIKTPQGPLWLTVPVQLKGHLESTMKDTRIETTQNWKTKHLKSLQQNYRKAPRFDVCYPKLEALYVREFELLSDLCFAHLQFWMQELGVARKIVRQTELPTMGVKSDLVFDLCKHFGADHYLSGALGRDYLDNNKFSAAGITVEFQDYRHPQYPQIHGPFLPFMGVVDFWMNCDQPSLITQVAA